MIIKHCYGIKPLLLRRANISNTPWAVWCFNTFKGIISFHEVAIIIVISSWKWENLPKFKELFQGLGAHRQGGWQPRWGWRAPNLWWHPNQHAAQLDQRTLFFCLHHSAVSHWGNRCHHLSLGLSHSIVHTWHLISVLSIYICGCEILS